MTTNARLHHAAVRIAAGSFGGEVADAPREFPSRTTAHIAFLSSTPESDIAHVARWAAKKKEG